MLDHQAPIRREGRAQEADLMGPWAGRVICGVHTPDDSWSFVSNVESEERREVHDKREVWQIRRGNMGVICRPLTLRERLMIDILASGG